MSLSNTILICGTSILLYDFCKNNPDNKYVKLAKIHITKSIEICPFLKKIAK